MKRNARSGESEWERPCVTQGIRVDFSYPVSFTRDAFGRGGRHLREALRGGGRAAVYLDDGVARCHPRTAGRVERMLRGCPHMTMAGPVRVVPGGEAIKNDPMRVFDLAADMARSRIDRHSYVVVIGGGAVLDAVGFAASLVHRGVRTVRMPTTALSQCDSGIGVKTGINFAAAKNMLGTFAPPWAVINDALFLPTLEESEWIGGIAESFKVAMIRDAEFFAFLTGQAPALRRRDLPVLERMIRRCAQLHLDHIATSGDPFEMGRARPLDFGHWAAHKIETLSGHRVGHGEAVAAGVALDTYIAWRLKRLRAAERDAAIRGLIDCGARVWQPEMALRDARGRLRLLEGLREFREHLGGRLCVTLPDGIGNKTEVHRVPSALVEDGVRWLERQC